MKGLTVKYQDARTVQGHLYTIYNNSFYSELQDIIISYPERSGIHYNIQEGCTLVCGSSCHIASRSKCKFKAGRGCTFKTGSECTFKTGGACTFWTTSKCKFECGDSCSIIAGGGSEFKTGKECVIRTGSECKFECGELCTFSVYKYSTSEWKLWSQLDELNTSIILDRETGQRYALNETFARLLRVMQK